MKVRAGKEVVNALRLAFAAKRSVVLESRHGIGKSQLIEQAAKELGIDCIVRDLSLMEPPDLIGLPVNINGRTKYSPPSFLPDSGKGLLVFEELNRSEKYMMAPCLQLLTARTLNDYKLPDGWLCVAAINPASEGYDVNTLDPALLSRFIRIQIEPDVKSWIEWGTKSGIHPAILRYVSTTPNIFDSEFSSPRSFAYASDVLKAYEQSGVDDENLLVTSIAGLLGDSLAIALIQSMLNEELFSPDQILESYEKCRTTILHWVRTRKMDSINACIHGVQVRLQSGDVAARVASMATLSRNLDTFIKDVPPDLGKKLMKAAKQSGAIS